MAGRDIQKVVNTVREALGGKFYVQKVSGCIKKYLATCFSVIEQYFMVLPSFALNVLALSYLVLFTGSLE